MTPSHTRGGTASTVAWKHHIQKHECKTNEAIIEGRVGLMKNVMKIVLQVRESVQSNPSDQYENPARRGRTKQCKNDPYSLLNERNLNE
jgi:hypothetical protein